VDEAESDSFDPVEEMAALEQAPGSDGGYETGDEPSEMMLDDDAIEPPAPPRSAPELRRQRSESDDDGALISAATTAAVDCAFSTLAQTVPAPNGRTLEDLVREMLRPMLRTWLDDNLPSMVERLVRAEIERVARARR
jgi:hypothetical protein